MPNKFSAGLIASGFAKGIGQGTQIKQAFGQRLGVQAAQKNRDTTYQNFLQLMQEDRQSFQNMRDLREHGFDMMKMRERERMANLAGDPTEAEDTLSAQLRIRKSQRDDRKLRLDEWKAGQSVFLNRIDFLQNELKTIDEFGSDTNAKRKGFILQQLRRAQGQLNSWLLSNPPPNRPGVAKTIREENELFKQQQKEKVDRFNLDNPLGLDLPGY